MAGDPEAEPLGVPAALDMLRTPVPDRAEAQRLLDRLRATPGPLDAWPEPESPLDELIIRASTLVFLKPLVHAEILGELRRVLGLERHQYLMLFLSFIRLAHFWTEVHPELAPEQDIENLLAAQRTLGEWIDQYQEQVQQELAERIGTELQLLEVLRERARAAEEANVALRERVKERTQAVEAAEAASRAKSEFLAVMSHELRTPLNAILGYADLLDAQVTGELNDDQKKQLERLRESGEHLLGLIEQVLSLSRIEAGRATVELERVDVGALAGETAAMVEPLASRKGLRFTVALPASPLEFTTDRGKVRQILLNLLSNAVKFTKQGGIELRGRLTVESELGRGSTFTLTLPVLEPAFD